jgi:hypothetical protein
MSGAVNERSVIHLPPPGLLEPARLVPGRVESPRRESLSGDLAEVVEAQVRAPGVASPVDAEQVVLPRLALLDEGDLAPVEQDLGRQDRGRRADVLDLRLVEGEGRLEPDDRVALQGDVVQTHDVDALGLGVDRVGEELHLTDGERGQDLADRPPLSGWMLLEKMIRSSMSIRYPSIVSRKRPVRATTPSE